MHKSQEGYLESLQRQADEARRQREAEQTRAALSRPPPPPPPSSRPGMPPPLMGSSTGMGGLPNVRGNPYDNLRR